MRESQGLRGLWEFGRVAGLPDGVVDGTGFPASASGMAALDAAPGPGEEEQQFGQ